MPAASTCPDFHELRQFMLGLVDGADAERLEDHLLSCGQCNTRADEITDDDDLVQAMRTPQTVLPEADSPLVEDLIPRLRLLVPAGSGSAEETPLGLPALPRTPTLPPDAEVASLLAPPQAADEIGRLGPYGVLRLLGSGGMGTVLLARQERPRRLVAVKMILAYPRGGRERVARFLAEAEVVARLQHPNIVQVHEVGEHRGLPYYAMELVDGGSLAQKLAAALLPAWEAARLAETLARAMHQAHSHGIVHRDLKPSNILFTGGGPRVGRAADPASLGLLTADDTPKIADFGLAKQLADDPDDTGPAYRTESGAVLGTPAYMAPEQAVGGSKGSGPSADVYALGAILYECLTGRPPFKGATVLETLEQVRSQEPLPPRRLRPDLPRDLQTICLKCLRKEPAQRYASAADLADDLGCFLRGEPIRARPVSTAERLRKWVRRKPALAALLAVSGLSLAVLVTGGLLHNASLQAGVKRAEAEKEEARRQHQLAAEHYRAATHALYRMLARGEGSHLTDEVRLEMYEANLSFYQQVRGFGDSDPILRRDTAGAFVHVGMLQVKLGRSGPGAEHLRWAVALLEGLPPEQRSPPMWQDRLAEAYTYLGLLATDEGRLDEAERSYRQVRAIRQRLAESNPEAPGWQDGVARSELLLGSVYRRSARWAEAESCYTRALACCARSRNAQPEDNTCKVTQATAYVELAHLCAQRRRPREAGAAFARAERLLTPLADAHPHEPQYALSLAAASVSWSDLLTQTGQPQAALDRASRAVDLTEGVLRRESGNFPARALARESHVKRAAACSALSRWAESVNDWDRVVALDGAPKLWARRMRVVALARAGVHARATAEAESLAGEPKLTADGLCDLACVYALSVESARPDKALAERSAARAVALVRKLLAQGYFNDTSHARRLWTDADLKSLRKRADFRKLLPPRDRVKHK